MTVPRGRHVVRQGTCLRQRGGDGCCPRSAVQSTGGCCAGHRRVGRPTDSTSCRPACFGPVAGCPVTTRSVVNVDLGIKRAPAVCRRLRDAVSARARAGDATCQPQTHHGAATRVRCGCHNCGVGGCKRPAVHDVPVERGVQTGRRVIRPPPREVQRARQPGGAVDAEVGHRPSAESSLASGSDQAERAVNTRRERLARE